MNVKEQYYRSVNNCLLNMNVYDFHQTNLFHLSQCTLVTMKAQR